MRRQSTARAVQLTWANWEEICEFVPKPAFVRGVWLDENGKIRPDGRFGEGKPDNSDLGLLLNTLNGEVLVKGGEWVVQGIRGEFYPVSEDIFRESYFPINQHGYPDWDAKS